MRATKAKSHCSRRWPVWAAPPTRLHPTLWGAPVHWIVRKMRWVRADALPTRWPKRLAAQRPATAQQTPKDWVGTKGRCYEVNVPNVRGRSLTPCQLGLVQIQIFFFSLTNKKHMSSFYVVETPGGEIYVGESMRKLTESITERP